MISGYYVRHMRFLLIPLLIAIVAILLAVLLAVPPGVGETLLLPQRSMTSAHL
jgi:hypothetical protein